MSTNNLGQGSFDSFFHPNTPSTAENFARNPAQQNLQAPTVMTSRSSSPAKRVREDDDTASKPGSEPSSENREEEEDEDNDTMDFQPTQHITETEAIGDDTDDLDNTDPQMAALMCPKHVALHADFEIITNNVMEQFYRTISTDSSRNSLLRTTLHSTPPPTSFPNKFPCFAPGSPRCSSNSS